jgi:hypothetical protein
MTTTGTLRTAHAPARRWAVAVLVLGAAVPSMLGLGLLGGMVGGVPGLLAPVALGLLAHLYRMVVASATTREGRAVSREVGAAILAAPLGFGAYAAMVFLGIVFDVVPFIGRSRPYPYEDDWNALSVLTSIAVAVGAWWVLRRWAEADVR